MKYRNKELRLSNANLDDADLARSGMSTTESTTMNEDINWIKELSGIMENDSPYDVSIQHDGIGDYKSTVKLPDGKLLNIFFELDDGSESTYYVEVERDRKTSVTGGGNAPKIFATVLATISDFINKINPAELRFSAMGSRGKLYNRMVAKYAHTVGYNYKIRTGGPGPAGRTDYQLTRKEDT